MSLDRRQERQMRELGMRRPVGKRMAVVGLSLSFYTPRSLLSACKSCAFTS
ncbi:hypothetical protein HMPREF9135_2002 [Segatella baroniae F0067]|uniref:Uncharacterized protein n=1 Tax=Segatella baroniae F0067 TaxID=1115809 RepID=U2QE03_9BACT|nr:hypothetical protein HMPREF9135_2002 [Segatella baroniae F0067]